MKVYLSSTFRDFEHHRATVAKKLRKAQYDVVMMEEYAARDEMVEFACQGDVASCDVYIGLFAWRYGYVPEDNNPQRLSVTEMEMNAAEQHSIPRLLFLAKEGADWPKEWRDADLTQISILRKRSSGLLRGEFEDAGDLAAEVLASLRVHELTRKARRLDAVQIVLEAQAFGPSYMVNIQEKLTAMRDAAYVELQTGPIPWWNTRLHLISALAEEYDKTKEFVFVDNERHFVAMAPPAAVRRQLEKQWPTLSTIYSAFRLKHSTLNCAEAQLWTYPLHISECLGKEEEEKAIEAITRRHLEYDLILPRNGEAVEVTGKKPRLLMREIIGRRSFFVVLERDGRVEGLIDRRALADKIAADTLAELE